MNENIEKVIYYIETHLDDELDIVLLAKEAGYSQYHFSRIFKEQYGESVMNYIARLKIQRAALHICLKKSSLVDISNDTGYQTPTGFLKAFKKYFNITPTQYKKNSKEILTSYENLTLPTPELITREDTYIVYVREMGEYQKSSDLAWQKLKNIPLDISQSKFLGICHDDPEITTQEYIRYDAAITLTKEKAKYLSSKGFKTKLLDGGKYVTSLHTGNFIDSNETYEALYFWIKNSTYTLRDAPVIEEYLNTLDKVSESELLTLIYFPIM